GAAFTGRADGQDEALGAFEANGAVAGDAAGRETRPKAVMPPLTLLHCITSYPAPETEYNVRCVETLRRVFGLPTGISDHSLDPVLIPELTVAEGGVMIEKHITLSRKTDGLDDPVALEPEQFAQMVQAVHQTLAVRRKCEKDGCPQAAPVEIFRQMAEQYGEGKVSAALGSGEKRLALSERANYGRTNRSLHYMRAMKKGERIGEGDVSILRTEKVLTPGISPEFSRLVSGCILTRDVVSGAGVDWEDLLVR
ncbi:MAG: N-acetylneuraminate synthase family protein, partial [Treponema sp.]|nr:N-acetylneuraminate synthase family protein [Treponema sp.]